MRLLQLITSLNHDHGGVVSTVLLSTEALNADGHQAEILTLDAPGSQWLGQIRATVHILGPAFGTYGYSPRLVPWLKAHAHEYDAVIVNGLWQFSGFAVWRTLAKSSTPYFVFTHGMLDPWFKHAYPFKHLKKWLYWPWAEYRVLRDAHRVIFTCQEESLLAGQSFWLYRAQEALVSLGVPEPPGNATELTALFLGAYPETSGRRILLFLSRIHEKKGCDLLVDAFAQVARQDDRLHLVMAGPDQKGWTAKLKARAERLGIGHRITWPGMLQGELKWGAFYAAEAFCLPSHHENFGMVVAEALACGKPVLISNKVQIWRDIEEDGAGFVAKDTFEGTLKLVCQWRDMGSDVLQNYRDISIGCFRRRFDITSVTRRLVSVIQDGP